MIISWNGEQWGNIYKQFKIDIDSSHKRCGKDFSPKPTQLSNKIFKQKIDFRALERILFKTFWRTSFWLHRNVFPCYGCIKFLRALNYWRRRIDRVFSFFQVQNASPSSRTSTPTNWVAGVATQSNRKDRWSECWSYPVLAQLTVVSLSFQSLESTRRMLALCEEVRYWSDRVFMA